MNIADVVKGLSFFTWVVVLGLLGLVVMRASRQQKVQGLTTAFIVMAVVAILLSGVGAGLVFIEPYESGAVISTLSEGGMRSQPLTAGLHWIVPFFERVERYPISTQTFTLSDGSVGTAGDVSVEARTSDGQRIFVDSSVIYKINPARVLDIHRTWQHRYQDDLILPKVRGAIRDSVSQYRVDEVVSTKRFEMSTQIAEALIEVFTENGLILEDFVLRDITFTQEYANSIEQKQIAEQLALQAQFVIEQRKAEAEQARQVAQGQADAAVIAAKGEAEARLLQAEAEAKSLALVAEVLQANPNLLTYEYIRRLAPNIQVILLPSNAPFILPLPGLGGTTPSPN